MKRLEIGPRTALAPLALASMTVALLATGCPSDPGELRPLFDEIIGLPGFDHPVTATLDAPPVDGWPRFEMGVRNIGASAVTIASVTLSEESGDFFSEAQIDFTELEPDDQAIVQFQYITPGGSGHAGTLTLSSDATNAELVVPVATADYVPPAVFDGGPDPMMDAGDPDPDPVPMDAGDPPVDAGDSDAG